MKQREMPASMRASVHGGSFRTFCAGFQRVPFGVKRSECFMCAFSDDSSILYDDGTDERVWMHEVSGIFRKLNGPLHIGLLLACKSMMH